MDDVDALYGLPPEEFVAARDRLVAARKVAGDRSGAAAVRSLRRPTVAAWAVNLAVRAAPELLAELLDLRAALVRAQRQVLSGVKADLAGLTRERRRLVEAMVGQAEAAAADAGRDLGAQREEVRLTFEAAVADEGATAAVRAGRLEKALPAPAGFGTLAGLTSVPPRGRTGADGGAAEDAAAEDGAAEGGGGEEGAAEGGGGEDGRADDGGVAAARADAAERVATARAMRDQVAATTEQAVAQARELRRDAERLAADAARAAAEVGRREREAEAAVRRAEQARTAAEGAQDAADRASGRADRAQARAEEAQRQLREADGLLEAMLTEGEAGAGPGS